uniref:Uncharacterized protein n=1 Tax=Lepeophtheirus salmonis TaxID=72036 RepID=A0A0K2VFD7_LEPSM
MRLLSTLTSNANPVDFLAGPFFCFFLNGNLKNEFSFPL